jgi:UDP:flavonoid glycosyltransferase YjiC (YdhE family)
MLDGPDDETFAALPEAIEAVLGDPRYRRAARDVADVIDRLSPVDDAPDLLRAIALG